MCNTIVQQCSVAGFILLKRFVVALILAVDFPAVEGIMYVVLKAVVCEQTVSTCLDCNFR